jgi:hypothetical protein
MALAAFGSFAAAAEAPAPPPNHRCPGPEYQQFMFWLGDWDVTRAANGQPAGRNMIELAAGGCALLERWTSVGIHSGNSINVYDQADGKWHQYWVDSTGDLVHYVGAWAGGKMLFRADDVATPQKQNVVLTMTFEPRADGTVRQTGTISTDGGKTFEPSFDLIYTKKK